MTKKEQKQSAIQRIDGMQSTHQQKIMRELDIVRFNDFDPDSVTRFKVAVKAILYNDAKRINEIMRTFHMPSLYRSKYLHGDA